MPAGRREAPQLSWAADATLEADERGRLGRRHPACRNQKATRQIEREQLARRKAVLLTAKAIETLDADPTAAKNAALEANRMAPDLVPAAVTAAQALFRLGDLKRGAKILEAAWKKEPHPEIADAMSMRARAIPPMTGWRAPRSWRQRPNHVESALVVARAAFEAGEYTEARKSIEAALRQEPREGTFLLLADVEEAETGEQGRVREWLARAVRAPRDPGLGGRWVRVGKWAPASPVTGRLDAFEWRSPVERLGRIVEAGESDLPQIAALSPPARRLAAAERADRRRHRRPSRRRRADARPEGDRPVDADKPGPLLEIRARCADGAADEPSEAGAAEAKVGGRPRSRADDRRWPADEEPRAPPIPDDPGVDPDEPKEAGKSRFKLF
jgi:HemY protein